jgi:hypothetical protein
MSYTPLGEWCLVKPGSSGVSPASWPDNRTKPAGETPALPGPTAYLSAIPPLGCRAIRSHYVHPFKRRNTVVQPVVGY